jgi:Disulphide bond corrector protein DsbC
MRIDIAVAAATLLINAACKREQPEVAPNPVKWSTDTLVLRVGVVDTVHLRATVDTGWYVYSLTQRSGGPTAMTIAVEPPFQLVGRVRNPQAVVVFDKQFGIDTERYQGAASFAVPIQLTSSTGSPPGTLTLKVRYQTCSDILCLPAKTVNVAVPVKPATT